MAILKLKTFGTVGMYGTTSWSSSNGVDSSEGTGAYGFGIPEGEVRTIGNVHVIFPDGTTDLWFYHPGVGQQASNGDPLLIEHEIDTLGQEGDFTIRWDWGNSTTTSWIQLEDESGEVLEYMDNNDLPNTIAPENTGEFVVSIITAPVGRIMNLTTSLWHMQEGQNGGASHIRLNGTGTMNAPDHGEIPGSPWSDESTPEEEKVWLAHLELTLDNPGAYGLDFLTHDENGDPIDPDNGWVSIRGAGYTVTYDEGTRRLVIERDLGHSRWATNELGEYTDIPKAINHSTSLQLAIAGLYIDGVHGPAEVSDVVMKHLPGSYAEDGTYQVGHGELESVDVMINDEGAGLIPTHFHYDAEGNPDVGQPGSWHPDGPALDPTLYSDVEFIQMDSYGDGWNGYEFEIVSDDANEIVHKTALGPIGDPDGSQLTEVFSLPYGDYKVVCSAQGSYAYEISMNISRVVDDIVDGISDLGATTTELLVIAPNELQSTAVVEGSTIGTFSIIDTSNMVTVPSSAHADGAERHVLRTPPVDSYPEEASFDILQLDPATDELQKIVGFDGTNPDMELVSKLFAGPDGLPVSLQVIQLNLTPYTLDAPDQSYILRMKDIYGDGFLNWEVWQVIKSGIGDPENPKSTGMPVVMTAQNWSDMIQPSTRLPGDIAGNIIILKQSFNAMAGETFVNGAGELEHTGAWLDMPVDADGTESGSPALLLNHPLADAGEPLDIGSMYDLYISVDGAGAYSVDDYSKPYQGLTVLDNPSFNINSQKILNKELVINAQYTNEWDQVSSAFSADIWSRSTNYLKATLGEAILAERSDLLVLNRYATYQFSYGELYSWIVSGDGTEVYLRKINKENNYEHLGTITSPDIATLQEYETSPSAEPIGQRNLEFPDFDITYIADVNLGGDGSEKVLKFGWDVTPTAKLSGETLDDIAVNVVTVFDSMYTTDVNPFRRRWFYGLDVRSINEQATPVEGASFDIRIKNWFVTEMSGFELFMPTHIYSLPKWRSLAVFNLESYMANLQQVAEDIYEDPNDVDSERSISLDIFYAPSGNMIASRADMCDFVGVRYRELFSEPKPDCGDLLAQYTEAYATFETMLFDLNGMTPDDDWIGMFSAASGMEPGEFFNPVNNHLNEIWRKTMVVVLASSGLPVEQATPFTFMESFTDSYNLSQDLEAAMDENNCDPAVAWGCPDELACNYDPDAIEDDGSCLYEDCEGNCGGDAVEDECGVCGGDGSSCPPSPSAEEEDVPVAEGVNI